MMYGQALNPAAQPMQGQAQGAPQGMMGQRMAALAQMLRARQPQAGAGAGAMPMQAPPMQTGMNPAVAQPGQRAMMPPWLRGMPRG